LELDAFNLLYVALTRAIKALYIITERDLSSDGSHKEHYYSGLFIGHLKELGLWDENMPSYSFGSLNAKESTKDLNYHHEDSIPYQYTHKNRPGFRILTTAGALWDTEREEALARGTAVHQLMEMVAAHTDADQAVERLVKNGVYKQEEKKLREVVAAITYHPELKMFYLKDLDIKNESDIITENGLVLRPDRLVFNGKKVSIVDYKTGKRNPKHYEQLYAYADALLAMGYQVEHKVIVYIDQKIEPEFI
jgi:ATP-dependent exoDNAse (exonuclease V) beta subunit